MQVIEFGREVLASPEDSLEREWLETNASADLPLRRSGA